MIKCMNWPISVCTWSLKNDFDKLNILRDKTGVTHLNLAVSPALEKDGDKYLDRIAKEDWKITSMMVDFAQEDYSTMEAIKITGGIVPDQYWDRNRKKIFDALDITSDLSVKYLALHFGFIDLTNKAVAKKLFDRARIIAAKANEKKILILMETGQEAADELVEFLKQLNHPAFAVNLDPANMILYNKGNPVEAVKILAPWIKHVHIKDALRTKVKGTWGTEVVWATGEVNAPEFLRTLKQIGFKGAIAVEREAGDDRIGDITTAINFLVNFNG